MGLIEQTVTVPKFPEFQLDGIYAWTEQDFLQSAKRLERLTNLVALFRFVLNRSHPLNADGKLFAQLLSEPEVRAFLDRLHERRKTEQEARQPPPQKPGPQ